MATRKQKMKVGVFLATCFIIVAAAVTYLSGLYEDQGKHYWIEFEESVLGLFEGGQVEYLGVPVGKVSDISVMAKSMMRGQFTIEETDDPPNTGEEPDHRFRFTNSDDKDYQISSFSSDAVFSGFPFSADPTLTLQIGQRYEATVANSGSHPLQILSQGADAKSDVVLLSQGGVVGALEEDPEIAWKDDGARYEGKIAFTVTQRLVDAMNGRGHQPGYRCSVHVFLARVELSIAPDKVALHEGVRAKIVVSSLATGTNAISLSGGDPQAPPLPVDSQIFSTPSTITAISTQIEAVVDSLANISSLISSGLEGMEEGELAQIAQNVNLLLEDGRKFIESGGALVDEASQTVSGVREDAKGLMEEFTLLSADLSALANNANKMVNSVSRKLDALDLDAMESSLTRTLDNIAEVSESLNDALSLFEALSANTLHEADNMEHAMRRVLDEVGEVFEALGAFIKQLKDDPSSMLRGPGTIKEPRP